MRVLGLGYLDLEIFMGEQLLELAQGDCVYLSTRVNLHSHCLHAILCGELQASVEWCLAILSSLHQQGIFWMLGGFYIVFGTGAGVTSILPGCTRGVCHWWDQSDCWKKALWEGLSEVLWDWLLLGEWWHEHLFRDWLEQHLFSLCHLDLLSLEICQILWGFWCHRTVSGSYGICTGLYSGCDCHNHSMIVPGLGICLGVVVTLVALGKGGEGVGLDGRCCRGHCSDGGEVGSSLVLGLLVLLTLRLNQFAVGEKGLVCELDCWWSQDPVPGLMCYMVCCRTMIFSIFCVWGLRQFALGDKGSDAGGQGVDTVIRELVDIGEDLIPAVPEILLGLDSGASSTKPSWGILWLSGVMVPLSMRDWKVCWSLPLNIIVSCSSQCSRHQLPQH